MLSFECGIDLLRSVDCGVLTVELFFNLVFIF